MVVAQPQPIRGAVRKSSEVFLDALANRFEGVIKTPA
jgi:hypothetical protein